MKKKVLALTLGLTMALSLAACGGNTGSSTSGSGAASGSGADASTSGSGSSGDLITVGFAQVGHESDWRTASTKSAEEVFSEENGYELLFNDADNGSAVQLEAIRSFIQQGVDYIIVDPIVSTGWDSILTECEDAGIPVIVIDRTIDDSDKYVSWVTSTLMPSRLHSSSAFLFMVRRSMVWKGVMGSRPMYRFSATLRLGHRLTS